MKWMEIACMSGLIHSRSFDARSRFAELGVPVEALSKAIAAGHSGRLLCTENDPPFIPGTEAWRFVIRTLRDELLPLGKGWRKADPGNFSLVINDIHQINIVAASADAFVCRTHGQPRTNSLKGLYYEAAAARNTINGDLFPDTLSNNVRMAAATLEYPTWVLLTHIDDNDFRGELSLPARIEDQRIVEWAERIFVPKDEDYFGNVTLPEDDEGPIFDPVVRRKN